jgi:gluconolactonase
MRARTGRDDGARSPGAGAGRTAAITHPGAGRAAREAGGNVYLTTNRAVQAFNRSGQQIETIAIPEVPANVCLGGQDRQTLFITARTGFYAVKTRVKGVGPQ